MEELVDAPFDELPVNVEYVLEIDHNLQALRMYLMLYEQYMSF